MMTIVICCTKCNAKSSGTVAQIARWDDEHKCPPPPSRYGQCDATCTVDCGPCKGAGPAKPIDVLNLPTRAANVLAREGVETIGQLTALTITDVLDMRNAGSLTVHHIEEALAVHGLKLAVG